MAFKIVVFDSDGIGAIGSALTLQRLDPQGTLIRQADMFAGNAMGAVTALALVHGLSLDAVINLFEQKIGKIFHSRTDSGVYCADTLQQEFIKIFGAAKLCELPLSGPRVMVNVERLSREGGSEWELHSIGNGRRDRFDNMLLADLAASAACADGHFAPHIVEPVDQPSGGRLRSAMSAENNPSASAMIYAEEHFHVDQADMCVLSLGTGAARLDQENEDTSGKDWSSWGWPFSRIARTIGRKTGLSTVDSNSRVSALAERYIRVEVPVSDVVAYDAWHDIPMLEKQVEEFASSAAFAKLARTVKRNWCSDDEQLIASHHMAPIHSQLR